MKHINISSRHFRRTLLHGESTKQLNIRSSLDPFSLSVATLSIHKVRIPHGTACGMRTLSLSPSVSPSHLADSSLPPPSILSHSPVTSRRDGTTERTVAVDGGEQQPVERADAPEHAPAQP